MLDLPDNPADWPTDPFALLGVEPGASEDDVRRAYTRLIRRFKPDHHPDAFRRIRAAYEACLVRTAWISPECLSLEPLPMLAENSSPTAALPATDDPLDALWDRAVRGDPGGYAELVRAACEQSDRADIPLRLYWLLAVDPSRDPATTRHRWLAESLRRSRLRGTAVEIYRRELEADPDVGLYDLYANLMETPASASDLLAVAHWRVAAAGRSWRQYPLAADLGILHRRCQSLDFPDADWLGVLVAAAGWAAWKPMDDARTAYREGLNGVRHLETSRGPAFDRIEETEYLAAEGEFAAKRGLPQSFVDLVRASWAEGDANYRAEVSKAAAAIAEGSPGDARPIRPLRLGPRTGLARPRDSGVRATPRRPRPRRFAGVPAGSHSGTCPRFVQPPEVSVVFGGSTAVAGHPDFRTNPPTGIRGGL